MILKDLLKAAQQLISVSMAMPLDEAAIDARLLLQHSLKVGHAWLIGHINDELTATQSESFQQLLARRLKQPPRL